MRTARRERRIGSKELTAFLALAMALSALGIDFMLPAFDDIRADLGMEPGATAVTGLLTVYFLGLALGQLIYGPLADRFGRRPALYVGFSIYIAGALAATLSPSLGLMLVSRFVWGAGAAGSRVVTMAVIRDRFEGERMSKMMSSVMAVFILVPVLAPTGGAAINSVVSWRWIFGACALAAVIAALWGRRLPETLHEEHRTTEIRIGTLLRSARTVVSNRKTVAYTLTMAAIFGVFTSFLGSSENMIGESYGRADSFPFIFGGLSAVIGLTMIVNGRVVERLTTQMVARTAMTAWVLIAVVYAGFTIVADGLPPFGVFLVFTAALLMCFAFLLPNLNALAMDSMAGVAGTAASIIGAVQTAAGALLGQVLNQAFDGTIRAFVFGAVGYGILAMVLMRLAEP